MLSKYCSDIANKYDIRIGGANKLVSNSGKICSSLQKFLVVFIIRNETS